MSGYLNAGVPHYAHPTTNAIRPREINLPDAEQLEWKARKMASYEFVRSFIRENWKEGDRFVVSSETRQVWDYKLKTHFPSTCSHANKTGKFKALKNIGMAWYVLVEWDDPDYSPVGLGKGKMGMFDFYHYGFKENNENS